MKITEALLAEHTILVRVFDQIEQILPGLASTAEIRVLATVVDGMLRKHAEAETHLAYLALDHVLANKDELGRMHQDHHEIDGRLKEVQTASTCTEARRLLKVALKASREHFLAEERSVFPVLDASLHPDTLTQLGGAWLERPTPSHPTPAAAS